MIPRILPNDTSSSSQEVRSAFCRRPAERPFTVIVDAAGVGSSNHMETLVGLDASSFVEVHQVQPGDIAVDAEGATFDFNGGRRRCFFRPALHNIDVLRQCGVSSALLDRPDVPARLSLAMLAQREVCDAFVSDDVEVLEVARRFYPRANPLTPTEALSAAGLVLRLREDFAYLQVPGGRCETSSEGFYTLLSVGLLPRFRAWSASCPHGEDPLDSSPGRLAHGVQQRLARALRARDRALGFLFRPPTAHDMEEALFYFDAYLLSLAGAFDATARVAGFAYEIAERVRRSWREDTFRRRLIEAEPAFDALLREQSAFRDVVDVVFLLRNAVHEAPLFPIGVVRETGAVIRYDVGIPPADEERLVEAFRRLGGESAWGIDPDGGFSFDPHVFIETSLPAAVQQIDETMALIDTDRFGASPASLVEEEHFTRAMELALPLAGLAR